ncbi:helix-turn-helix domain-containing protein [Sphingorhabdus sp. EL138]|uniref:helix-turn-helix domain-containing protein n=1 Tax=Sphingorhabdus sp. EL138 TaxID=2073156 RepID=UPI000D694E9E|nr:helix-turn-helix transcriptional regulator [Sphingorhabdus sp. EL138]
MEIKKRVGLLVREQRRQRGWSQEELADRADLHRTFISSIERGIKNATINSVHTLATAMGLTVSELLEGLQKTDHAEIERVHSRDR